MRAVVFAMITGSVLSISLVSNSSQSCSYRNLLRTFTSQCSDKQSRSECVLAEIMARNPGLAPCICGSPGQTDNGVHSAHYCSQHLSSVVFQGFDQSQQVTGTVWRLLSLRILPGRQCDSCRERKENWIRRKDAVAELFVSKLKFATVLFQLVRNTLRGPRTVDYRIGTLPVATSVPTHQRSPGERLSSP